MMHYGRHGKRTPGNAITTMLTQYAQPLEPRVVQSTTANSLADVQYIIISRQ